MKMTFGLVARVWKFHVVSSFAGMPAKPTSLKFFTAPAAIWTA